MGVLKNKNKKLEVASRPKDSDKLKYLILLYCLLEKKQL